MDAGVCLVFDDSGREAEGAEMGSSAVCRFGQSTAMTAPITNPSTNPLIRVPLFILKRDSGIGILLRRDGIGGALDSSTDSPQITY